MRDDDPAPDDTDEGLESRRRFPRIRPQRGGEDEERLAERLAHQWQVLRAERRPAPATIPTGPSNFSRAQVPWGVDLAAAWAWRFLVIVIAGYALFRTLGFFSVVALPLAIAVLITALVSPVVGWLSRIGLPRGLAAIFVVLGSLAFVSLMLTFAGPPVARWSRGSGRSRTGSRPAR